MSCGCSNTTPIVTTTNCGSCGYNCSNCTCPTDPIVEPAVVCADPEPCSELFPLQCVIYTGPDIKCSGTADTLYPGVLHYLVIGNSTTVGRNFVSILNNINTQLCYLFSKDYISQFLTNIQNDPISELFCNIASSCNCLCTLTCPVVTSAIYNSNTLPASDTITGSFTRSILGSEITFQGTIVGTTLTIDTAPASPGYIAVGQKITGTNVNSNTYITAGGGSSWTVSVSHINTGSVSMSATWIEYITSLYLYNPVNSNFYYIDENTPSTTSTFSLDVPTGYDNSIPWLVSVQATDLIADMIGDPICQKGYYAADSNKPVNSYIDDCGWGQIAAVPALECPDICIPNFNLGITGSTLIFGFTHTAQAPNTYPVSSYIVHWYKQTYFSTNPLLNEYTMLDINDQETVPVTTVPQSISVTTTIPLGSAPSNNWLILVTPIFENIDCNGIFAVREPIYEVPNVYTGQDFINQTCNWSIYNHKQKV